MTIYILSGVQPPPLSTSKHFYNSQRKPVSIQQLFSISRLPQLLSTTHHCFVSVYLPIVVAYSAICCLWLSHFVLCISPSFRLWLNDTPLYGNTKTPLCIPWWTFGLFPPLGCCGQRFCEYAGTCMFLNTGPSSLSICLGMELKGQMVVVHVTFWGTTKLVFSAAVSFTFPFEIYVGSNFFTFSPHLLFFYFVL